MAKIISSNSEKYTSDHFMQVKQTIQSNNDVLERIMTNIAYNPDVQIFLTEPENAQSLVHAKRVDSLLMNTRTLKEGIVDIIIHGEDGRSIDIAGEKEPVPFLEAIEEGQAFHYYGLQHFGSKYSTEIVLLIGAKIKYLQPGEKINRIGTLFLVVAPHVLIEKTNPFSTKMNALSMFVDKQMGVALSGSDSQTNGIEFEDMRYDQAGVSKSERDSWNGTTYVASIEYLPELNGSIVDMIPKDALMRDMNAIRFSFIWIFVFGAVFVAVMFTIITSNILLNKNDSLAKELLDTNVVLSFMQLEKKKAELAYLRCQINPHFLYNTLEMIKGMAAVKGVHEIREAAALLGSIFYYSVKGGGNVPCTRS